MKRRSKKTKTSRSKEREEKWVEIKRGYATTAMKELDKKSWAREKRERETLR